jgi:DNA topoisomerase-1
MKKKVKKVSEENLCINRRPYGRGYRYYDENDKAITDKKLLKRLKGLIIPPMWDDVMICNWEDGHIQATGRDAKGRKQYIYHSKYEEARQQEKFDRMLDFGKNLPAMRKINLKHVKKSKWSKEKVLSLVVMVLDETGLRIGNRQYAERNGTYGLTTLRRKHIEINSDSVAFEYKGKSNQIRQVEIDDTYLSGLIKKSSELPGYELFRYKDDSNQWRSIDSDDVNQWIHEHMGDQFSSKDFRTWVASRLAIELYPDALSVKKDFPRKKFTNILLRLVADELGNTPTVCKSYYIHPIILGKISEQSITWSAPKNNEASTRLSSSEKYLIKSLNKN